MPEWLVLVGQESRRGCEASPCPPGERPDEVVRVPSVSAARPMWSRLADGPAFPRKRAVITDATSSVSGGPAGAAQCVSDRIGISQIEVYSW